MNRKLGRKSRKGFSLVELLVVIAVIGVIAAIAIPAMSGIFENSRETKARKNAQNIASTFAAARAAGYVPAATVTDAKTAADALNTGVKGKGQFATTVFQVALNDTEQTQATTAALLSYDKTNKVLTYNGTDSDVAKDTP